MFHNKITATEEYIRGLDIMGKSAVSICSIVRDCEKNLNENIARIERLRSFFKKSEIVVFENDSKDDTKSVLKKWMTQSKNVTVFCEDFNSRTIPSKNINNVNRYFSIFRIEKMAFFRNKYIEYLNGSSFKKDYVIVIDLDISNFDLNGVVHSFGITHKWDCLTANGISLSSRLSKQYHDSYAFIELGKIQAKQTEDSIRFNRSHYAYLKPLMPLLKVDSAYGGLAIYKWQSLKGLSYSFLTNNDERVESKCEHAALHKAMKEHGFDNIYINPSMIVKYRSISLSLVFKYIKDIFQK